MNAIPQQFAAQQQAAIASLAAAQSAVFAGFEQLVDLNLKVAKATLDAASERAREASAVTDPQQAIALAASVAQPGAEQLFAYGKQVFDIVAGVQAELGKLTQGHIADGRAQVEEAVEHWASRAPAGSDAAVAALKNTLASGYGAYDTFTRVVKQASEAGQSNLNAAAKATFKAASAVASDLAANAAQASGGHAKAASRGRRAAA